MTSRTELPTNPFRAPERALPAKTQLDEFDIETVLALGSFGIVYRAYDHLLRLHVAIKEYLPDALAVRSAETQVVLRARAHAERFDQGLQAFMTEAQTLARCEHPSLLRITRIVLRHGTAYRVMRYSPGPSLLEYRRELGATPDAQVVRGWLDALLGALEALHEDGCVHAAVAPDNILLLPGDKPLLLDFEAVPATLISGHAQGVMAALEPCFEPIEQREPTPDSALGPWTDLYALAATLHYCISGELPPPPAGAGTASRFEPLSAVWQRLRVAQPELGEAPPWLDALDTCLIEDPSRRPQSVAQLREQLGAGVEHVAAGSQPTPQSSAGLPVLDNAVESVPVRVSAPEPELSPAAAAAGAAHAASAAFVVPAAAAVTPAPAAVTASDPATPPAVAEPAMPAMLRAAPLFDVPAALTPSTLSPDPPFSNPTPPPAASPPGRAVAPVDPARAMVMADLDKTFAFNDAQANEETPTIAPPAPAQAPDDDASTVAKVSTRQKRFATTAALLLLFGLAAGVLWMNWDSQPGVSGVAPAPAMQSAVVPTDTPPPAPASYLPGSKGNAAEALDKAAPSAGPAPPEAQNSAEPPPVTPKAKQPPPAAPKTTRPPPAARKATAPLPRTPAATSPRDSCGQRSRFALYECMQKQCAQKKWSKHPQCVRLRKEQKLG